MDEVDKDRINRKINRLLATSKYDSLQEELINNSSLRYSFKNYECYSFSELEKFIDELLKY